MEDGWYIACPNCWELSDGSDWKEAFTEYNTYWLKIEKEEGSVDWELDDTDGEQDWLMHTNCGFRTENYSSEELLVKVENNTIVKAGQFWIEHPDYLKKLVEKNGLKIARGVVDE